MSIVSIFLVIFSASIHVGWNFLIKSSQDPKVFSLLKVTVILCFAVVSVIYFPVQKLPGEVWIYIGISGIIHGFYILSLSSAYEVGDISFVYPIARSAPAFVPIVAFLALGESISVQGGMGILIVMIGMYALLVRRNKKDESLRFLVSLKKKDNRWAFITLGTIVAYTIIDKAGMSVLNKVETIAPAMQGPLYLIMENILCCLIFWTYMILRSNQKIKPILVNEWPRIVIAALGTLVSYSLILYVMRIEKVSYIVTMRQASVLIAVLVGWLILKEQNGKRRLAASLIMLIGFYLVGTAK